MGAADLAQYAAVAVMVLGTAGIAINRVVTKKGVGGRVIQWLAIVILPPTVLILALQNHISNEMTGAIIAALAGFATSEAIRNR